MGASRVRTEFNYNKLRIADSLATLSDPGGGEEFPAGTKTRSREKEEDGQAKQAGIDGWEDRQASGLCPAVGAQPDVQLAGIIIM